MTGRLLKVSQYRYHLSWQGDDVGLTVDLFCFGALHVITGD
jgi:hypothetical protein